MMLISGELMVWIAEYRVVVLPEPVGPVMRIIPKGLRIALLNCSRLQLSKPSLVMSAAASLSRSA